MTKISRGTGLVLVLTAALGAAGCQSLLPGDGPSRLAMRQAPVVESSGQKLGPDGYPLLGAFPRSAAPQIDNATVVASRTELQSAAASRGAGAASSGPAYQAKLAEMEAIKAAQRKDAAAALAPAATAETGSSDPEAVLREIEGQR